MNQRRTPYTLRIGWLLVGLALIHQSEAQAASLGLSKAAWSAKKGELTIKGKLGRAAEGASVDVYDINGRRLGTPTLSAQGGFTLTLAKDDLVDIPCAIRAQSGDLDKTKPVAGAPKFCKKTPSCRITEPVSGYQATVNEPVQFKATAKLPKSINHPKYEWDFAGGAMGEELTNTGLAKTYQRPVDKDASVAFVRNNSKYRVRFIVTDGDANLSVGSPQYRCEDSVDIAVGTPPDVPEGVPPMAAASVASAPQKASEANGEPGDLVVLPFQDWTMQHWQDGKIGNNVSNPIFAPSVNNLNAVVIKKGGTGATEGPQFVRGEGVEVTFSAASNPSDPVGAISINSTSQNWPVVPNPASPISNGPTPLLTSLIQKTDQWEIPDPPANVTPIPLWYVFGVSLAQNFWAPTCGDTNAPRPDEGYFPHYTASIDCGQILQLPEFFDDWSADALAGLTSQVYGWALAQDAFYKDLIPPSVSHGSYMPGIANPYSANDVQNFTLYDSDKQWFVAQTVPTTSIDDQGRVNPDSLFRVEVFENNANAASATTDAVLSNGRDLHCRGCHAKGQIAANPNAGYKPETYLSSLAGQQSGHPYGPDSMDKPQFWSSEELGGEPGNLFEEEYAANRNIASLHAYYDGGSLQYHEGNFREGMFSSVQHKWGGPGVVFCVLCHISALRSIPTGVGLPFLDNEFSFVGGDGPSYSVSMHRFHGELQYTAEKTDIIRNDRGTYVRFDSAGKPRVANTNVNPKTLFPIFGEDGKQLPMEQNCLKCHAGHREPLYRDRMYTAGVTCFDCHGDMLSQGGAFPKDASKVGSKVLADYRKPWFDEPDCGSCHVGNANIGKTDTEHFFSAGVRKRAFADTDPAATQFPVDKADPDAVRFAVVPDHEFEYTDYSSTSVSGSLPVKVEVPLYRYGIDTHGKVACAACHGAAHAVAPNRDPSANDNVAAVQLQGYPGHILECKVCHTTDAFKDLANLDGSIDSGLPEGVLGGPHNLHPVNDPNWYRERASGDQLNTDGTQYGGWHNVVAGLPGVKNEDQCAACHGDDHKGTRLSRTPVDRVFDFRGLDFKKLKKVGFKKQVIKVAAGSIIGCNTCHDLKTSNSKLPTGGITPRHSPVIAAEPAPVATIAQPFSGYQVSASDEDGGALTYRLLKGPDGMSMNDQGLIAWDHVAANPDDVFDFHVQVSDETGLSANRWFIVKPACPEAVPLWDAGLSTCTTLTFTSDPLQGPSGTPGLDAGQTLSYTATASTAATFSLVDAATGQAPAFTPTISIDANTGVINWTPDATTPGTVNFRILATDVNDANHKASQDVSLGVCQLPEHWDTSMWMCMTPAP